MSHLANTFDNKALLLRRDAENRLRSGSAHPSNGLPLDKEALVLLYAMASDPERSSDALRLLQELQVHQVEIDLQREELENNEREMGRELTLYKALFELTPTVCLVVTKEGRIIEANPAAVSLLNTRYGELAGQTLHDFLQPESHGFWTELLAKLQAGEQVASGEVLVGAGANKVVPMMLTGSFLPEGEVLIFGVLNREPVLHDSSKQQRAQ